MRTRILLTLVAACSSSIAADPPRAPEPREQKARWYEKLTVRGYGQVRYNRLGADLGLFGEKNDRYTSPLGDRSIGRRNGLSIRRARLIVQGDVTERVFVYVQPDFSNTMGDATHFVQMRDFYADVALDEKKELRLRVGQSKVPYGWENLQSSQNRLTLDRSEPINTAIPGERDLGVFAYYAPASRRALFKRLVDDGLKGSGDYGVVALGVYNGQGANQVEKNDSRHVVARVSYPFEVGGQILEAGVAGYYGKVVVPLGAGANVPRIEDASGRDVNDLRDMRAQTAFVLYPRPVGLQAEVNVGVGPETRDGVLKARSLWGGYGMLTAKIGAFMPFVRYQRYHGGRKSEINAPTSRVSEIEPGVEWQPDKAFELTVSYAYGRRTCVAESKDHTRCGYDDFKAGSTGVTGQMLRVQAQFNY
ncbi:MAG: porin [Polyangiaceae bacterium]|nr:porin [Polyangiaceae bacterium]